MARTISVIVCAHNEAQYLAACLHSWKTLVRCEKNWPAVKRALRANVDIALTLFGNGSWATA